MKEGSSFRVAYRVASSFDIYLACCSLDAPVWSGLVWCGVLACTRCSSSALAPNGLVANSVAMATDEPPAKRKQDLDVVSLPPHEDRPINPIDPLGGDEARLRGIEWADVAEGRRARISDRRYSSVGERFLKVTRPPRERDMKSSPCHTTRHKTKRS